jgi:hypothetical protein
MMAAAEMGEPSRRGSRLLAAAPGVGTLVGGSALWALGMMLSALVSLWSDGWAPASMLPVALLFAAGGGAAFAAAVLLARVLSAGRPYSARFAASFLLLAGATLLLTILFFWAEHRLTFQQDYPDPFTADWILGLVFSLAAAFYRFALFGVALYLPLGLVLLFTASFWNAQAAR